jgi:large subunit ribosomal protein L4
MADVVTYTKSGTKSDKSTKLDKLIFGLEPNHQLISLAYNAYLANGRSAGAETLTRGMVRGGGRKPWRQKGTGRARVGSSRVPNWRGGGIVFGPTGAENHTINMPTKMKRQAIKQALSMQAKDNKIAIIETFSCPDGKVKPTLELLAKIKAEGNILLVVSVKDLLVDRATRNISGLKAIEAKYLNVYDIMNSDLILISEKSVPVIEAWLGSSTEKVEPTKKTAVKSVATEAKSEAADE